MATQGNAPFQVMRSLTTDEYRTLKTSIELHGILEPILVDEAGNIVDGHHRAKVATQLGIEAPTRVLAGFTHDELVEKAHTLNRARRHLTQTEQREFIAEHLLAAPKESNREIARRVGCDDKTVASVRREMVSAGDLPGEAARVKPKKEPNPEPVDEPADDPADIPQTDDGFTVTSDEATLFDEDDDDDAYGESLYESAAGRLAEAYRLVHRVAQDLSGAGLETEEWESIARGIRDVSTQLANIALPEEI